MQYLVATKVVRKWEKKKKIYPGARPQSRLGPVGWAVSIYIIVSCFVNRTLFNSNLITAFLKCV